MESHLSVTEARARLPEILDRVAQGDEITITRHGQPVAVLVAPNMLRVRRGEALIQKSRRIGEMIEEARHKPLPPPVKSPGFADDLVRSIREDRDRS